MTLILPVRHFKQESDWDCGVTCLRMLIDYYHADTRTFEDLIQSYQCNESTWTIDLLHLLHQIGINATLHTITIGCSSTYDDVPYYKTLIHQDRERVKNLFASEANDVRLGSVEWSSIERHLTEQRTPCLVLVDANKLLCSTCQGQTINRLVNRYLPILLSTYQGHYILVIGFIKETDEEWIRYVDPGKTDGFCTTTKENFNRARTAFGTDEDVIFCYKKD